MCISSNQLDMAVSKVHERESVHIATGTWYCWWGGGGGGGGEFLNIIFGEN